MARQALPVGPLRGRLRPLGLGDVEITGGFWAERRAVNSETTLAHCSTWLENRGWLGNFDRAAAGANSERSGPEFADSETYKVMEACAWETAGAADPQARAAAERLFQSLAARVVAAQQPDGYLNTRFGGPQQAERYSDLPWGHELYCAGHLIQAAVARLRTAGEDAFVRAAYRVADHVSSVFGPGGREEICGHPEIETALTELSRATGIDRYRETATAFVERRGYGLLPPSSFGSAYFLDDVPVRRATVLRGHAVRALYLSAAAVDVATDTGDGEILAAVVRQWDATVARRTYLTGGMGSRLMDESFGDDFELPPDGAYSETCAGIASIMLAWRLLLATGDERFADAMERAMYNVVAASVGRDGRSFFYANTLHRRVAVDDVDPTAAHPRAVSGVRAPWFDVSCCPTNSARFLASLPGYLATADDDGIQLHQYAASRIRTSVRGMDVDLDVETAYPADGRVTVTIRTDTPEPWSLSLRVPEWAAGTATLDGVRVDGSMARVNRVFRAGDTVVLDLPVTARLVYPDHRIDAVRGTVAVMRGPLVQCVESIDLPGGTRLDDMAVLPEEPRLEGGRAVLRAVTLKATHDRPYWSEPGGAVRSSAPFDVPLVPYHEQAERGPSAMRVWVPLVPAGSEATT